MRNDARTHTLPRLYPNGDIFTRTEPNRMKSSLVSEMIGPEIRAYRPPAPSTPHAEVGESVRAVSPRAVGEVGALLTATRVDMFNALTDYVAFMLPKVDRLEEAEASAVYEFAASIERKFAELATAAGARINVL